MTELKKTPGKPPRGLGLDKLAFGAAVIAVAFGAGMAAVHYNTLPYRVLNEAKAALNAELKMEDDALPSQIGEFLPRPSGPIVRTLAEDAGEEAILIPGGLYSRLDQCPKYGCLAWVVDRSGKVLHSWPAPDPDEFFKNASGFTGRVKPSNFYVIGVAPHRDGSLVVTFHARNMFPYQVGVAKFDIDGRLLWKRFDYSHHWPTVGEDGTVYVPYTRIVEPGFLFATATPIECDAGKVYNEGVRVISPDGKVLRELGIDEAIARSDYPGIAYAVQDGCDPFHVNGVDLVTAEAARRLNAVRGGLPEIEVGDILVSVREASSLVVLDHETGDLKRVIAGRTSAQHSPHFLPDGRIVVFDNLGGDRKEGGSRVQLIDPETRLSATVFPTEASAPVLPFNSETSGAIRPNRDGRRLLVAESKNGRLIEVDITSGRPLWVYDNLMDFKPYLVANKIKHGADTFVRPPMNGGFYINDIDFLPEVQARLTGAASSGVQRVSVTTTGK